MLRALFFDFDGTITDAERLHCQAFCKVLGENGVELDPEEYFSTYLGFDDADCIRAVLQDRNKDHSEEHVAALDQKKSDVYFNLLENDLVLFPGVETFIKDMAKQFPMMVTSGAKEKEIVFALKKRNLLDYFVSVVSADHVKNSKPNPEAYIQSLRVLSESDPSLSDLRADECLAFEDSPVGIRAAKDAGMFCLALPNSRPPNALHTADQVLPSFEGVSADRLRALFDELPR